MIVFFEFFQNVFSSRVSAREQGCKEVANTQVYGAMNLPRLEMSVRRRPRHLAVDNASKNLLALSDCGSAKPQNGAPLPGT
jgi:hypothetical protein